MLGIKLSKRRKSLTYMRRNFFVYYLMVLPALIYYLLIIVYPLFTSIRISFYRWNSLNPILSRFIGLQNYRYAVLLKDPKMWPVLRNTMMYTLMSLPATIILGLLLAIVLNKIKFKTLFRVCYFIPVVVAPTLVASIWQAMFQPDYGVITPVLTSFGIPKMSLLNNPNTALPALALVSIWQVVGFRMIIFLAGLQGIPDMYYEAAILDGASKFQRFVHITIPLLKPIILFVIITGFIGTFQIFDQVLVMTEGGPGHSTLVYILYLYTQGFQYGKMGYASTLGIFLFALLFLFAMLNFRLSKARGGIY